MRYIGCSLIITDVDRCLVVDIILCYGVICNLNLEAYVAFRCRVGVDRPSDRSAALSTAFTDAVRNKLRACRYCISYCHSRTYGYTLVIHRSIYPVDIVGKDIAYAYQLPVDVRRRVIRCCDCLFICRHFIGIREDKIVIRSYLCACCCSAVICHLCSGSLNSQRTAAVICHGHFNLILSLRICNRIYIARCLGDCIYIRLATVIHAVCDWAEVLNIYSVFHIVRAQSDLRSSRKRSRILCALLDACDREGKFIVVCPLVAFTSGEDLLNCKFCCVQTAICCCVYIRKCYTVRICLNLSL